MNLMGAIRAVFASGLSSNDKLVALALLNHWSRSRETFPGVERLVAWTSLSRRSVQRSVQRLEAVGALKVERKVGLANRYDLSPLESLTSATQTPVPEGHQCLGDTPPVPEGHPTGATVTPHPCHTDTRSDPVSDPVRDPAPRKHSPEPSSDSHELKLHYVAEFKRHRGGEEPDFGKGWSRAMKAFGELAGTHGKTKAKVIVSNAMADAFTRRINPWELVDDANKHLGRPPQPGPRQAVQRGVVDESEAQRWGSRDTSGAAE